MKFSVRFETFRKMEGSDNSDKFISSFEKTIECSNNQLQTEINRIGESIKKETQKIMDAEYNPKTKFGKAILARIVAVVKVHVKQLD